MLSHRPVPVKRLALLVAAVVALTLFTLPSAAYAATSVISKASAIRVDLQLLGAPLAVSVPPQASWSDGRSLDDNGTLNAVVGALGVNVVTAGAAIANAGPATGGGRAEGGVTGLNLLNGEITADAVKVACQMTASDITTTPTFTNVRVGGSAVSVAANATVGVPGVLTGRINARAATWNTGSGEFVYTLRGLDLQLLKATAPAVSGSVVIGEAICQGTIKLGTVTTTGSALRPGDSGTPTVTVSNTGDVAATNTTIRIPKPDAAYYTLGTPSVPTGSCDATGAQYIVCSGVTVPGGGTVKVSLPVTLKSSATGSAPAWLPTAGSIEARSTPVPTATAATMTINGGGTALASALPRATTGGTITVNSASLTAGKTAAPTIKITNAGPSDADTTTVTVPIGNVPTGVRVTSATASSGTCTVNASDVTCTNVSVPANGDATITLNTAAALSTPPGTAWELTNIATTLNGRAVSGYGRLVTVTDPDVNLDNGVSITPAAATPGGAKVNATVRLANLGALPATGTTVTFPAAPSGYTLDAANATGGACAMVSGALRCTVNVPAMSSGTAGAATLSVPVTLASGTTANWTGPVTATSGDSTGTATGTLVSAVPRYTLSAAAQGPAARTVSPGQSTTMTVDVSNQGPSNAVSAPFVVVAPYHTTFGPLTGALGSACQTLTQTTLRCTVTASPTDPAITLALPLQVSTNADPSTALSGGCVSLDNDSACGTASDSALPDITLRPTLASRLTVSAVPATITPGNSGSGRLTLTSTQAETGMRVTIPKSALPTGFTVSAATVDGGTCDVTGPSIVCTGVDLAAAVPKNLQLTVQVAATAAAAQTWTANGITVQSGNEQITTNGALATTGVPSYTLTANVSVPAAGTVLPGGTANVPLTVTNTGPSAAAPATFTVTAPNGTTIGALDAGTSAVCQVNAANTQLTCSTGLAAGTPTQQLTLPLVVAPNADPDKTISGSCIDLDGYPGCGSGDATIPPITLKVPAASQIGFSSSPVTVTPGDTATAKLSVSATRATLSSTTVTIPLTPRPAGLTVSGVTLATGGTVCPIAGGVATCTIPTITTSTPQDINVALTADPGAAAATWTVSGAEATIPAGTVTVPDQTLARIGAPRNVVTATVTPPGSPILPGNDGTLSVSVNNAGPSDATGASFTVIAPNGATFTTPAPGSTTANACTVASDGRSATCTFDQTAAAPPTVYPFNVQISSNVQPGTGLTGGCVDVDNNGVCTSADTTMPAIPVGTPLQAQVAVTTTRATVTPGATTPATATLTITAPSDLQNLVVTTSTAAPTGLTVLTATGPNGTCNPQANGTFNCGDVDLGGPNHSAEITFTMTATGAATPATWTPAFTITAPDAQTAAATGTIAVIGAAQTSLTTTTSGPGAGSVDAGTSTNVTVNVANAGPSDAANQIVIVTALPGTTFGTPPVGCQTVSSTRLLCRVDVLSGGSASLSLPVVVPANADIFSTITGGCVDVGNDGTCEASLPTIALRQPVERRATVTVTPVTVTPGSAGNAVVRVTADNGALTNFTITVPVTLQTAGLTVGTITPGSPCTASSGTTVTCTWPTIAKGSSQDITIPVQADAGTAAGVKATTTGITIADVVNTANLPGRQLAVTTDPQFTINPSYGTVTATEPGQTATIPVTLTNAGPSDAATAQVGVVAPAGTTFGTPLPTGCVADTARTTLTCTATSLGNGQASVLSVPVVVPATADPTKPITGGCVDVNNNGACTTPPDTNLPDIPLTTRLDQEITVRADRAALDPGTDTDTATLTITSTKNQTVDVTIPLADLPTGWSVALAAPVPAGCAVNGTTSVTCTGLALTTGANNIAVDVTTAPAAAADDSWYANNITVTGHTNQTVTSGSLLAYVGTVPYVLTPTVSGVPQDFDVLPGDSFTLTVSVTNSGSASPTLKAPLQVTAPTGTTFGTTMPTGCVRNTATTVNCLIGTTTTGATPVATLALPIQVPGNAAGGTVIQDGCVDLDTTGTCDVTIPQFRLRAPIADVLSVASTTQATPVPGRTATATVNLTAATARPGLSVSVNLGGLPAGVTVNAVRLGGQACTITAGTATCPATNFAGSGSTALAIDFSAGPAATPGGTWRPAITVSDPGRDSVVLRPVALTVGAADAQVAVALGLPEAGSVLPGGTADVAVTMTNNGTSDNPNAQARLTAPAGTTFDLTGTTAADYCVADSSTQITCTTALAAGAMVQFRVNLKVAGTATAGAAVSGGCVDVPGGGACDTTIAFTLGKPFSDQAMLSYAKVTVTPGDIGTGYIRVTTDRGLSGLSVTVPLDRLPARVDIAGASGPVGSSCTVNSAEITCSGVTLPAGAGQNLVAIRIHPASDLGAGVVWAPVATLSNGAGGTSLGLGVLMQTSAPAPDVKFTMSAPAAPVAPGDPAAITGTLDNDGFSDLTNASVRVKAPTGTTFDTPLPTGCALVGNALLDCTVTLPAGAAAPVSWALAVRIPANADPAQPVTGGCVDLDRDNVCEPGEPVLPAIQLAATLAQALTLRTPTGGGASLTPGATGTVTVAVASTQARTGMTVTIPIDTLPSGMQIVQARTDNGSCSVGQRAVTCTNVSVTAGGTADIVLTSLVSGTAPTGTWSPAVTVSQGSQSKEQTITGAATVTAPQTDVRLAVGVPASQTVLPGGTGTLTLTATNAGPSQATGLTYTVIAPTGTTFPALTGTTASTCTRVSATQVNCPMTVAGNGRSQVSLPISVDATVNPANPVSGGCVRTTAGSACSGSDTPIPPITLATPLSGKLQLAGVPATVVPGRTGSGVLRITSTGPVTGATVTIPLAGKPDAVSVIGAAGPAGSTCAVGATEIRCTGVNLTTGSNAAVTVTTSVAPGATGGTTWRSAGVTVTAGGETATGLADLITTGEPVAAVTYRTTNATTTVRPGDTTSLSVAVTNAGPSNATRKTATLVAPDNTRFGTLTGTAAQDCTATSASVLTCTYSLEAAGSKTWTVPLIVSSGVKDGDKLTGGCISADGNRTCGSDLDVSIDETPVSQSISRTGTLALDGAVIAAGASGTASVRLSATVAHTGLTLTVPLSALPDGFSVTSATLAGATCAVGGAAIRCSGVDLAADQPKMLSIGLDVASSAASTATWWATGITLADPDDATDKLTASGLLVSTSRTAYAVGVTVGSPSSAAPLPGQTTTLPITFTNAGPGDANPYTATIVLPVNTTAGPLPSGCVAGPTARTIVCTITLAAGAAKRIQVPVVVGEDLKGGETITGGCVDEALGTNTASDGECGGDADVAIPEFVLGRYKVNLAVRYNEPAVTVGPATPTVQIRIPYTNEGTNTADNVQFTIVPPAGVVVRAAAIELDGPTVSEGTVGAAAEAQTVAAECVAAEGDLPSNAVVCTAPDTAGLNAHDLLLTVDGSRSAKSGTYPMRVTISTTSAEGTSTDNTVAVMLKLTAKAAGGGDDDSGNGGDDDDGKGGGGKLPTTGAQIAGTALISLMLIVAGATLMIAMRENRPAGAGTVRIPVRVPGHTPRHARPRLVNRWRRWGRNRLG